MPKTVNLIVEGGKATPGPPLGPSLAPMGINVKAVVDAINQKTKPFAGVKVPVKVIVDTTTKEFSLKVGSPSTAELVKKELKLEKLASKTGGENIADMRIEQAIKIAKMKEDSMLSRNLKNGVKMVVGSCVSLGVLVEGKPAKELIADINKGVYDTEISQEKTELSAEELREIEAEKKKMAEDTKLRREKFEALAKKTVEEMKGQETFKIKHKLEELGIPKDIMDIVMPKEAPAGAAAAAGAPAAGAAPAAKKEAKK